MMGWKRVFLTLTAASLSACTGRSPAPLLPLGSAASAVSISPIRHVVFIVQENRTPDNLFQGLPGADISKYGLDEQDKEIPLHEVSLAAPYGLAHAYGTFVKDYDGGKMDGWSKGLVGKYRLRPYGYAPQSQVQPYLDMAEQYVFADHTFEPNRGPSFPAHLYIVSGTAGDASLGGYQVKSNAFNKVTRLERPGECGSPPILVVDTIDLKDGSAGPTVRPCFNRAVLSDLLDEKNVSWRYYQMGPGGGRWHALNSIEHVRDGPDFANVIPYSPRVLTDIAKGNLPGVAWIMPADTWSDHAGKNGTADGPAWVAAIVNAIGKSKYWKNTAIFVYWDDWGGWYDHVRPPVYNAYEMGFRVPLIVISPYAKQGYVSKTRHEFGSLLAFTEETFGIPKGALHTTDFRADDLRDCFDFTQKARTFVPIKAPTFKPKIDSYAYQEDE